MYNQSRKLRRLVWIGSIIATIAISLAIVASWILYTQTINVLTENLRERLLSISVTQAANISAKSVEALQEESDWLKPEWREVVSRLKRAKDMNENIVFMYIFRKSDEDPTQMEFVADAESIFPYANLDDNPNNNVDANADGIVEPEGADYLQWPGQPYPEAVDIPEAFEAYNGPLTVRELYEDSYGRVLTGYAPIMNNDGEVVAILATDIKADDFFKVTEQTLYPFLLYITFLVMVIAFLSITLIYIWRRRADSLEQLSSQLTKANERLKLLDRMKSEFLSIASHQLRSPLTSIKGYASLLLEKSFGEIPAKAEDAVRRIYTSSELMVRSVEDFLNVSRIEQGRMVYHKQTLNLVTFIDDIVKEQLPAAKERDIALNFKCKKSDKDLVITADPVKLKQALTNLIDNSIKYTPKGKVDIIIEKVQDDSVIISIADTGIGISKENIKQLFDKFVRARNANSVNVNGTGLGLYVAKQMIEAHDGHVWAKSKGEGKGTTFCIEIPLSS